MKLSKTYEIIVHAFFFIFNFADRELYHDAILFKINFAEIANKLHFHLASKFLIVYSSELLCFWQSIAVTVRIKFYRLFVKFPDPFKIPKKVSRLQNSSFEKQKQKTVYIDQVNIRIYNCIFFYLPLLRESHSKFLHS